MTSTESPDLTSNGAKDSGFISTTDKREINWIHTYMLVAPPLFALYGFWSVPLQFNTFVLAFLMYLWTGFGITAGYHRLWSHRAYSASLPVRIFLLLGGSGAFEGSIKWWCRNHRAHHRYTDTSKDPYNARNGFWYSHLGWMLYKQNAKALGYADISDLNKDPMILWQHKHYLFVSVGVGVAFPIAVASLWGDAWGGFFFASMLRMVFVHHATFFVNSLAHYLGGKQFSDFHTAVDSVLTALLTFGEGYHNFHHEFPQDYRNAIKFYQYDPTKWLIKGWELTGLVNNLKTVPEEEIEKAKLQMEQREIDSENAELHQQPLPQLTQNEIEDNIQKGSQWIIINGVIYDVKKFVHEHPGGRQTLLNYIGKDVTTTFYQGKDSFHPHVHSSFAVGYLPTMKVGTVLSS